MAKNIGYNSVYIQNPIKHTSPVFSISIKNECMSIHLYIVIFFNHKL